MAARFLHAARALVLATLRGADPARLRPLVQGAGVSLGLVGLAVVGEATAATPLDGPLCWLLPAGLALINLCIFGLTVAPAWQHLLRSRLIAVQAAAAIATISVYAVVTTGQGELVPLMYLATVLVTAPRVDLSTLRGLSVAAGLAGALALLLKALLGPSAMAVSAQLAGLAGLALCLALANVHAQRAALRQLQARSAVTRLHSALRILKLQGNPEAMARSFRRQHIAAILEKEKARADRTGKPFSVCMLDLDHLSAHLPPVADGAEQKNLRSTLAERARRILRTTDTVSRTRYRRLLGRSGAEEFLAVLPDTGLADAQACALRVAIVSPPPLPNEAAIGLAAGVAEYQRGESISSLLIRADQALHAAQRSGPGVVKGSVSTPRTKQPARKPGLRLVR